MTTCCPNLTNSTGRNKRGSTKISVLLVITCELEKELNLCIVKFIYYRKFFSLQVTKTCTAWKTFCQAGRYMSNKECNRIAILEKPMQEKACSTCYLWMAVQAALKIQAGRKDIPECMEDKRYTQRKDSLSARWLWRQILANSPT